MIIRKVDRETLRKMIKNGEDVSNADTSEITDMESMFYGCSAFNQDISGWSVSKVEGMKRVFKGCESFKQDLSKWDISNVKEMKCMFQGCEEFEFKTLKRKISKKEHLIGREDYQSFSKEKLIDYIQGS